MSCQRLGWREPGHVRVRELVDEDQRRAARERGVEIEFVAVRDPGRRSSRAAGSRGRAAAPRFPCARASRRTPTTTSAFVAQRSRGGQHRVGLADARRRSEIDAQPAARSRPPVPSPAQRADRDRADVGHAATLADSWPAAYALPRGAPPARPTWPRCRARGSARATLTRGSPRSPNVRPAYVRATSARTRSTGRPRACATRATW